MTGNLFGRQYRVVGRVVLGEEENGRTYYWNEFNLESSDGNAILVHEKTVRGVEWRLFHLFDPASPMTAQEAATKRLGDGVTFDGVFMFVRFLSLSRVFYVEGKAPEGVKVGSLAHYFNAVTGNKMIVVSWTGEEVEFYHGQDLSSHAVSTGFNVALHDYSRLASMVVVAAVILIFATVFVLGSGLFVSRRRPPAVITISAPASPLMVGQTGKLVGRHFRVQSHAVVEMAMVGEKFDRHEYLLSDDEGAPVLLVQGSKPGSEDWWLFQPGGAITTTNEHAKVSTPLNPQEAAAIRWGQTIEVDGTPARVGKLFLCAIRKIESPEASDIKPGDVYFGFTATAPNVRLLVRWNAQYLNVFRGQALAEKDVLTAFGRLPGK
jgi:hypothetical protein